jgi:hypothetical protein
MSPIPPLKFTIGNIKKNISCGFMKAIRHHIIGEKCSSISIFLLFMYDSLSTRNPNADVFVKTIAKMGIL